MASRAAGMNAGSSANMESEAGTTESNAENDNQKNGHRMPTIFDAVKASMLVPVQTIVESLGPEVLHTRDERGHTPAHWSSLGGQTTILRYIIEMKGLINEASENDLGQKPIHWACVNGHIAIVDILLQAGISINVTDFKGCTPLIVACQYGQTMLAGYLMGKGASLQTCDKDGDTALHWAAFKGHNELMRLLVYSGFSPHQKDNFGQTPLHLACINGNMLAVRELCEQDQVDINIPDRKGKTPLALAIGRKHECVVNYLKKENKSRSSLLPKIDIWFIIFGPPGNKKGPLLFFLVNMFCWAYPMYIIKCLPMTWYELQSLHIIFMAVNAMMWMCLYHASTVNPGYLPRNTPAYDRAIREVAHFDEWKQGHNPLSRLCHTCRTVKPIRTKHCRICNRCVKLFDHHCPYIYNCVGVHNRVPFYSFVGFLWLMICVAAYMCLYMLRVGGWDWFVVFGLVQLGIFSILCTLTFTFSCLLALRHPALEDHCTVISFYLFAISVSVNACITTYFAFNMWSLEGWGWNLKCMFGLMETFFFGGIGIGVAMGATYHALINLTTNERINFRRYKYLQDGRGKFYNPYDRGWKSNLLEHFHLKRMLTEEEVEFLNVTVI